jgi:hypothetical protein
MYVELYNMCDMAVSEICGSSESWSLNSIIDF